MIDPLANLAATLALTLGVAWASGLNLYAVILALGLIGHYQLWPLPADLEILAHPAVLLALFLLVLVWLLPLVWQGVRAMLRTLRRWLGGQERESR